MTKARRIPAQHPAACFSPAKLQRRRGTRIGEHSKLVLSIIDRQVH